MPNTEQLQELVLRKLGYEGLVTSPRLEQSRIPGLQLVYESKHLPLVYFSAPLREEQQVWELYRGSWNHSRAPLLYVFIGNQIRVYNSYADPARSREQLDKGEERLLRNLTIIGDELEAERQIEDELIKKDYDRLHLDTDVFWTTSDGQKVNREKRADMQLMKSLDKVRLRLLKDMRLAPVVAYALLSRVIFIKYLEDRGMIDGEQLRRFVGTAINGNRVEKVIDILPHKDATYALFRTLSQRFNGDIFPVSPAEQAAVGEEHLKLLVPFLQGADVDSKQLPFWPYDFKYIPVELISGIYESFLQEGEKRLSGAYYTPAPLVDLVLEETMPHDNATIRSNMTVLDPACGSGIFLSRAWSRLVDAWGQENDGSPAADKLEQLMLNGVFGVDKEETAAAVTKFSLYLALLDRLGPDDFNRPDFRLPTLNRNIIHADFFDTDKIEPNFGQRRFDRIVGNLPWGDKSMTEYAKTWAEQVGLKVADNQISQPFLIRLLDFCAADGQIAVLAPARNTMASANGNFRSMFWERAEVNSIVNLSALVYELFKGSLSPAVAMFYHPKPANVSDYTFAYAAPKPSPLSQQLGAIVIDSSDVKYLDASQFALDPTLWKIAAWGTARDAQLIQRLRNGNNMFTLGEMEQFFGWKVCVGVNRGKRTHEAAWLRGRPMLDIKQFRRYWPLDPQTYEPIDDIRFEYTAENSPDLFEPPVAIIRQSPMEQRCAALYSEEPIVYPKSFTGVKAPAGQEWLLKWLVAYLNSPLATYYQFLTASLWAVERGFMLNKEFEAMPFYAPEAPDELVQQVIDHFDEITELIKKADASRTPPPDELISKHERDIAELIMDIHKLTTQERQLVSDVLDYQIPFFYWAKKPGRVRPLLTNSVLPLEWLLSQVRNNTLAIMPPGSQLLEDYTQTFRETVEELLREEDMAVNATVYINPDHNYNAAPLTVVSFDLVELSERQAKVVLIDSGAALRRKLDELDALLLHEKSASVYARHHLRIYQGAQIDFVRPSESRFWTASQALADADALISDLLRISHQAELAGARH